MSAKKILLIVVAVLVLAGIAVGTILHGQASVTKVATGKVGRQDLTSIVNGTGQIKPKTYVNVGATAFGRITHLYVKEGDHVKAGTVLAKVESVQPEATIAAQQATIDSSRTDVISFAAAEKTAERVLGPYTFEVLHNVSHWIPEMAPVELSGLLIRHLKAH